MIVERRNDRWKLTAIGTAFLIGGVLETGLVVAQWTGNHSEQKAVEVGQGCAALRAGAAQTAQPACSAEPFTRP